MLGFRTKGGLGREFGDIAGRRNSGPKPGEILGSEQEKTKQMKAPPESWD